MSSANRPQYKPTPELQRVVNNLAPAINQNFGLKTQNWKLLSFSNYPDNPNKFTFYIEGSDKRYKLELEQEVQGNQAVMKILQAFEIVTK